MIMRDPDLLALYDALGPDERAELDAALAEQPALSEALASWRSLQAGVRSELAHSLPDRALLVLYALADDGDLLTADERQQVEAARADLDPLLARHPGLRAAVQRIQDDRDAFEQAWSATTASPPPVRVVPMPDRSKRRPAPERQREEAPAKEPLRPAADREAVRPSRRRAPVTRWAARTAALVAVVGFGALVTWIGLRDAGWETLSGAQTVTFADGSTAELMEGARIEVLDDRGREARLLAGTALFRVETDPTAPFGVTTPNAEVAVLGTTFSVEATDVETEVVLVEGAVSLAPRATPDEAIVLEPGQRSRVLALDAPSTPEPADLGTLSWTGSLFIAEGTTAGEVARQLATRFDMPVGIDPALAGEALGQAELSAESLDAALQVLAAAVGGDVVAAGEGRQIVAP